LLVKLPYNFVPRAHQEAVLKAIFVDGYKYIYVINHRRAGKTRGAVNNQMIYALQVPGLHLYLLPQSNQARKVVWSARGTDGVRFLEQIPPELIQRFNNIEMSITLINGSILQFVGSNNYDSLIGTNPRSISYDEYALQNPLARELLAPILLENDGVEFVYTTPRGHNHAWELYDMARNNPLWFVQRLTIEDTFKEGGVPIVTEEKIERERLAGKSEEIIQQEYYCSFDIGNQGAYYTKEMEHAEYENRIVDFDINPHSPVYTSWDIGVRDSTAVCFFQSYNGKIHYIGYIEGNGKGVQDYKQEMEDLKTMLGFKKWGYHWAPHDIRNREWGSSALSRLKIAASIGLHFQIAPELSIQDRISGGRAFLPDCVFHKTHCKQLIRCMREAMREYDEVHKIFKDTPLHNWALHGFDSFTYGAIAWRDQFTKPELNSPKKYQLG
jgi:hypothetical protein